MESQNAKRLPPWPLAQPQHCVSRGAHVAEKGRNNTQYVHRPQEVIMSTGW